MKNPHCGHEMEERMDKNIWHCPRGGCAQWLVEYYAAPAQPVSLLERLQAYLAKISAWKKRARMRR